MNVHKIVFKSGAVDSDRPERSFEAGGYSLSNGFFHFYRDAQDQNSTFLSQRWDVVDHVDVELPEPEPPYDTELWDVQFIRQNDSAAAASNVCEVKAVKASCRELAILYSGKSAWLPPLGWTNVSARPHTPGVPIRRNLANLKDERGNLITDANGYRLNPHVNEEGHPAA